MNECVSAELIWKMFARIDGGMKVAKQKEIYVFSLLCKSTKKRLEYQRKTSTNLFQHKIQILMCEKLNSFDFESLEFSKTLRFSDQTVECVLKHFLLFPILLILFVYIFYTISNSKTLLTKML